MKNLFILLLITLSAIAYPNNSNANKIIGKWIDIEKENLTIEFEMFGDNISLVSNSKTYAVINKNNLYYAIINGIEKPILYDNSSDIILFDSKKYKRFSTSLKEKALGNWKCNPTFSDESTCSENDNIYIYKNTKNNEYYIRYSSKTDVNNSYKLNYSSNGYLFYEIKSEIYNTLVTVSFEIKKYNGKLCLVFEGGSEGDFYTNYYVKD